MYRCPHCHDLSISASSTLFTTLSSTVACPTCMTALRIKRKSTNYLVIAYMCLRAILSSVLPGGYHVEILIEANVIIALTVIQFLLVEYEVVSGKSSQTSSPS
ncbi:nucleoside recognition membrane protein YjiH [Massilia sp. MP_M2]